MSVHGLIPANKRMVAVAIASPAGKAKFFHRLPTDVLRHASKGPIPVRKIRNRPIGIIILLKKGGPTVILYPRTHSERIGNSVPQSTATQAAGSTRVVRRKLAQRERSKSSMLDGATCSRCRAP